MTTEKHENPRVFRVFRALRIRSVDCGDTKSGGNKGGVYKVGPGASCKVGVVMGPPKNMAEDKWVSLGLFHPTYGSYNTV